MVEFIYEPWSSVVVHEIVQYDLQTLIHLHALGTQAGQLGRPMNWAKGIAFRHMTMPSSEEIIKEQIRGKIHWTHLAFAFMPKHQQAVKIKEGNVTIPVLDLSDNILFRDMAEWIKRMYRSK